MSRISREFIFACILNAALIIGVVVFEWSLVDIVFIYFIEIAVINVLFFSVALFAQQPVDELNGDFRDKEPTLIQPVALIPPIYRRNIEFVREKAIIVAFVIGIVIGPFISGYDFDSRSSLSIGLAIAGVVFFQLTRVLRYFIVNQSYRNKSPADAIDFAFIPVIELLLMLFVVAFPVTFVLLGAGSDFGSLAVWLLYLVPMGAIRAWMGSLDPHTDDFSIN